MLVMGAGGGHASQHSGAGGGGRGSKGASCAQSPFEPQGRGTWQRGRSGPPTLYVEGRAVAGAQLGAGGRVHSAVGALPDGQGPSKDGGCGQGAT